MPHNRTKKGWFFPLILIGMLVFTTLPYLAAALAGGADFVFAGFLHNPIDGNSYLAKMYQGWQGHWQFKFTYTAGSGEGAYLFLFYLLLGHLARILDISLPLAFHLARFLSLTIMLLAMHRFFSTIFLSVRQYRLAFSLAAFGSGMGWLGLLFGTFTSDFWVAEAYPFLSAYANPHFPLGLALLLWLLTPTFQGGVWKMAGVVAAALVLSIVLPFGVVVTVAVLSVLTLWEYFWLSTRKSRFILDRHWFSNLRQLPPAGGRLLLVLFGSGPVLLYYYWVISTQPSFIGWNNQNITPSPPWWDFLISFTPTWMFALVGAIWIFAQLVSRWRTSRPSYLVEESSQNLITSDQDIEEIRNFGILFLWAGLGVLLLILPFGLQRRFIMGIYLPLAGLATLGVRSLAAESPNRYRWLVLALFLLVIPTNLIVLLASGYGIQAHDPSIYLTRAEAQALTWISENTPKDALILAAPETGLFVPAFTGRRVVYGHPFETLDASAKEAALRQFFQGEIASPTDHLSKCGNYLFIGPRELAYGARPASINWLEVYRNQDVTVYILDR